MTKKNSRKKVFYGWYLLIAVWLLTAVTTGMCVNSFNQFLKPMTEAFGWSRTEFTLGNSLVSIFIMGFSPFVGQVFAKLNPKKVLWFGIFCLLSGWFGYSFVTNKFTFYLMAAIIGFGSNFTGAVITNIVLNNWFHAKKGFAMGFATTGSGFGSAIFNPIASALIVGHGFQYALRFLGVIAFVCIIPVAVLFYYKPADIGLVPYEDDESANKQIKMEQTEGYLRSEAYRTPKFYCVCFIAFAMSTGAVGVFSQISPYLTDIGYSPNKAASIISVISLSMAFSKIFFGWLNDKIGTYKNFLTIMTIAVIGMFMLLKIDNQSIGYIIAVLFGVAFSTTNLMSPLITVHALGSRDFGNIFGIVSFSLYAGPLFAGLFSAIIFDNIGSYKAAFIIYAWLYVIALVLGGVILRKGYKKSSN